MSASLSNFLDELHTESDLKSFPFWVSERVQKNLLCWHHQKSRARLHCISYLISKRLHSRNNNEIVDRKNDFLHKDFLGVCYSRHERKCFTFKRFRLQFSLFRLLSSRVFHLLNMNLMQRKCILCRSIKQRSYFDPQSLWNSV